MPLHVGEVWRYQCAVCEVGRECRPGRFPDGWRRITIRGGAAALAASNQRVTAFEDHVCSVSCAQAAIARAWDPTGEPALRTAELDRVARQDAKVPA